MANKYLSEGGDVIDETAQDAALPKNLQPLYKSAIHKHGNSFTKTTDLLAQQSYVDALSGDADIELDGDIIDQGEA